MSRGLLLTQRLLIAFIAATGLAAQSQQEPIEHWYNPGVGAGAPRDVAKFIATADGVFVGQLEDVSVAFIDDKEQKWLFTTLRFAPSEWIKRSAHVTDNKIDVLTSGGTYVEVGGRRSARKPAEVANALQRGAEYLVAVDYEERPNLAWTGRHILIGKDAFSRLDPSDVRPVLPSNWLDAVLAQAPRALPAPGQFPSRRDLVLATLRAAAAAQQK
jgi:hypothetical protein